MRGLLQFILNSLGGWHIARTEPPRKMSVRPREQLLAIREAHGTAFAAALAGAINAEEYLLLDADDTPRKVVQLRPAVRRPNEDDFSLGARVKDGSGGDV